MAKLYLAAEARGALTELLGAEPLAEASTPPADDANAWHAWKGVGVEGDEGRVPDHREGISGVGRAEART